MSKTHTHTHTKTNSSVCRKRSWFLWKICSVQAATFFYLYTFTWKYKWLGFSNKYDYNLSIFLFKFCQSPNQTFLTDCIHVSCLPLLTVNCDWFVCNSGVHCWNGYFFKYRVCASLLCVKGDVSHMCHWCTCVCFCIHRGRNMWGHCSPPMLQQEPHWGAFPDCQVLVFTGKSGRNNTEQTLLCRR